MPNKKQKPKKSEVIKKTSAKLFKNLKKSERPSFVGFDDKDRSEWITGFHKRKLERQKEGRKILEEKIKKEKKKEKAMIREELNYKIAEAKKEKDRIQNLNELSDSEFLLSIGGFDGNDNPFGDDGPKLSQREQKKLFLEKQNEVRYQKSNVDVVVKTEYLNDENISDSETENELKDEIKEELSPEEEKYEIENGNNIKKKLNSNQIIFESFPSVETPSHLMEIYEKSNEEVINSKKKKKKGKLFEKNENQPTDSHSQRENRLKWERIGRKFGLEKKNSQKNKKKRSNLKKSSRSESKKN